MRTKTARPVAWKRVRDAAKVGGKYGFAAWAERRRYCELYDSGVVDLQEQIDSVIESSTSIFDADSILIVWVDPSGNFHSYKSF